MNVNGSFDRYSDRPDAASQDTTADPEWPRLAPEDARALDALITAGFRAERTPDETQTRAQRLAGVLSLLDPPARQSVSQPADDDADQLLIDVTLARVHAARRAAATDTAEHQPELSPADEDALEALVAADYDPDRTPRSLRPRAQRLAATLGLLESGSYSDGADQRIEATLERVQRDSDTRSERMTVGAGARTGFSFNDLISVAAIIVIGFSVLWPAMAAVREQSRRAACQSNFITAGAAFGQYSADNRDSLPLATPSRPGNPWWFVGRPEHSNSANLFVLTRTGYADLDRFACDGNPHSRVEPASPDQADWRDIREVSYSYQNMFAHERPTWTGSARVVLVSDRSPVVLRAIRGEWINPYENSPNHGGRGQNVLFNDGSVKWLTTPVLETGDNIWLPRFIEDAIARLTNPDRAKPLQGTESPASADDSFVGP